MRERRDLLAVQVGHLRVQQRGRLVRGLELRLEFLPASVEQLDLGFAFITAISSSSIRFRSVLIRVLTRSISRFADERLARRSIRSRFISRVNSSQNLLEKILLEQLLLKRTKHTRFHLVAPDGEVVVAPSLIASTEASEPVLA